MYFDIPALLADWLFGLAVEIIIYEQVTVAQVLSGYTVGISFYFAQVFVIFRQRHSPV